MTLEAFERYERLSALTNRLSDDFLDTLAECVKICGWEGDHTDNFHFVEWVYALASAECPELTPYEEE